MTPSQDIIEKYQNTTSREYKNLKRTEKAWCNIVKDYMGLENFRESPVKPHKPKTKKKLSTEVVMDDLLSRPHIAQEHEDPIPITAGTVINIYNSTVNIVTAKA